MPDREDPRDLDDWFGEDRPVEEPTRESARPTPRRSWNVKRLVLAGVAAVLLLALVGLAVGALRQGDAELDEAAPPAVAPPPPAAEDETSPLVLNEDAVLSPGDSGRAVRRLQRALVELGYEPGGVDGNYGPETASAVRRFQEDAGLAVDGVAGRQTLRALNEALAGRG